MPGNDRLPEDMTATGPEAVGAATMDAPMRWWFAWWVLAVFLMMDFLLPGVWMAAGAKGGIGRGILLWSVVPVQIVGIAMLVLGARLGAGSWCGARRLMNLERWRWRWLWQGAAASAGLMATVAGVTWGWKSAAARCGVVFDMPGTLEFFQSGDQFRIAALAVLAIGVAPVFEELAFRHALFGLLRRKLAFWPSAVTAGALFALSHCSGLQFPGLLVLAVCWQWINRRSGSLWSSIVLHFFNNLFAVGILWTAVYFKLPVFE